MGNPLLSYRQVLTAQSVNYYNFLNEYTTPEKYASSILKYKIFCCVWAIAAIFHMANANAFTGNLTYFLFTCAAIALIAKPSSMVRLLIFIIMQMYQAYAELPVISNHWLITTFVNLTILQAFVYLIVKRRSFYIDKAELLDTFAPLVKMELIVLYFYAVFHKLNAGFFDTESSCAVEFLMLQNNYYNILPSSKTLLTLNIYATLLIETLIPVLIIIRRTRAWGILLGLLFHCVLAYNPINGFYDFSSMIFALYFLFTGTKFSNNVYAHYEKFLRRKINIKNQLLQFNLLNFVLFVFSVVCLLLLVHYYNKLFQDYFRHIVWTLYSLTYIVIFALSIRSAEKPDRSNSFTFAHYSLLLFPVLVFLNGLCPYLGLKTEASYAMFSNLRTEAGETNHYLVPASTQLFDYQKDVVEIKGSTDPELQQLAESGKLLTFFQFRTMVRNTMPVEITYVRNGEPQVFELHQASLSPELLQKDWFVLEKLMRFRTFYRNGYSPCSH
ncbi:hypothetical protein FVR03_02300 [Pontibacter qinzhouensis]|uniref:HTTM domain-containing protein n=1 Tax=Pontibacter qinzhouensis TaxID=2603253 RepID=A0A5C8KCX0_9BACT|nr:hypothetical protein [Pontibacter qinzhouensis]TXK52115.1 hypothetical protein FVR03_02300 [Pontibacter qinzhouensis]